MNYCEICEKLIAKGYADSASLLKDLFDRMEANDFPETEAELKKLLEDEANGS